jgi:hypothetical protein
LGGSSFFSAGLPNIPPPKSPPAGAAGAGVVEAGADAAGAGAGAPNNDGVAALGASVGVVVAGLLPNENIPPPAAGAAGAGAALAPPPNNPPLGGGRPVDVPCSAGFCPCPNNPPPAVFVFVLEVAAVVPNILPPAPAAGAAGLAPNKPPPEGATGGVEAGVVD